MNPRAGSDVVENRRTCCPIHASNCNSAFYPSCEQLAILYTCSFVVPIVFEYLTPERTNVQTTTARYCCIPLDGRIEKDSAIPVHSVTLLTQIFTDEPPN